MCSYAFAFAFACFQQFSYSQISCGKTANTNALYKRIIYGLFNASHNL